MGTQRGSIETRSGSLETKPGAPAPLGSTLVDGGVNFSVFAREAERVSLLLFDSVNAKAPSHTIELSPEVNRSFHYWHVLVVGLTAGQVYAYKVDGPWNPSEGNSFNQQKLLFDPYGRLMAIPDSYDRGSGTTPLDNTESAMRSVVVDSTGYNWEDDVPLNRSFRETIIYELHVKGFTQSESSGVAPDLRGTYAGLVSKIPYLKSLGITAVELLPVFAFDPEDAPQGRLNYWGYSPVSFFAIHAAYAKNKEGMGPINEFRDMVKAMHRAGIEVILDVVFNHTSEGDARGPTQCLRGFGSGTYYIMEGATYSNYSGTGNTLNANHSVTRRLIQDSLRYWVQEMHVDGFRFDLASILSRDERGHPLSDPPTLASIETDPILSRTKLIAEPWDAGGLYQVGSFIGDRWREWNGKFRDDVRSFVKGDDRVVRSIPNRLFGSPDLYEKNNLDPEQSVNFVTSHDGFTMNDLVSYNQKHNEANGEGNADGDNQNLSWNHGIEGPSESPEIEALRERQIKNLFTFTLISAGVPMLLMGDEVRRTQFGNNNAYAQDNDVSWFDWTLLEKNAALHRFVQLLISWRRIWRNPTIAPRTLSEFLVSLQIEWHGTRLHQPDWSDQSKTISCTVGNGQVHVMFNSHFEALDFELPEGAHGPWRRFVDTFQPSPNDIISHEEVCVLPVQSHYTVGPRSAVVLLAQTQMRA